MKVHSLANLFQSTTIPTDSLKATFDSFTAADRSRLKTQKAVHEITRELFLGFKPAMEAHPVLVPILRGALPMWQIANEICDAPASQFVWCRKKKGTQDVIVEWLSGGLSDEKSVILLDTVIATGDTIFQLVKTFPEGTKVFIYACYVSPEAIEKLSKVTSIQALYAGFVSQTVDSAGYLVPYTHGDIGDKLFGSELHS